jgi:hypothetical protein
MQRQPHTGGPYHTTLSDYSQNLVPSFESTEFGSSRQLAVDNRQSLAQWLGTTPVDRLCNKSTGYGIESHREPVWHLSKAAVRISNV